MTISPYPGEDYNIENVKLIGTTLNIGILPEFTKDGYRIAMWINEEDGSVVKRNTVMNKDKKIYAEWKNVVEVVYKLNGEIIDTESHLEGDDYSKPTRSDGNTLTGTTSVSS